MHYQVVVGNIGTVYDGTTEEIALASYDAYKLLSREPRGRASGEAVTVLRDGEPWLEFPQQNCTMEIGNYFSMVGYDIMAKAQHDHGDIVILSNNSTHLLVASMFDESMTDGETSGNAKLEAVFSYSGSEEEDKVQDIWQEAYHKALDKMVELTLGLI
jgi:hypothetical protein